jgi:hypothetical protein
MPVRPCPKCGEQTPRLLQGASSYSWVNYYWCGRCKHVWNIPKDTPDGPIQHVTPPPEKPDSKE